MINVIGISDCTSKGKESLPLNFKEVAGKCLI